MVTKCHILLKLATCCPLGQRNPGSSQGVTMEGRQDFQIDSKKDDARCWCLNVMIISSALWWGRGEGGMWGWEASVIRSGIIRARDRRGPTGRKLVAMIISHQAPAFISNWLSNASPVSFIAQMSMKYVVFFRGLYYLSLWFHNILLVLLSLLGRKKTCAK